MSNLRVILCLGQLSHNATLRALGLKQSAAKFGHGAVHPLAGIGGAAEGANLSSVVLVDSYHCSRYNTNTGRLTPKMFEAAMAHAKAAAGL